MMQSRKKAVRPSIITRRVICYALFFLLFLLLIFPLYVMFVNATRSTAEINSGFSFVPSVHFVDNWNFIVKKKLEPIMAFKNSMIISTFSSVIAVYTSMMMAYSLVIYKYKLRGLFYGIILASIMIPGQVTVIGFYKLVLKLHMGNTFYPLILPTICSVGMIYFFRQYLLGIVQIELIEAGRVDGASEFRIFQTIMFPICVPAMGVQIIMSFVGSWNSLYMPSLILTSKKTRTLTVLVTLLKQTTYANELGAKFLCLFLSIIPMLLVFMIFSRFIIEGISLGSVKG